MSEKQLKKLKKKIGKLGTNAIITRLRTEGSFNAEEIPLAAEILKERGRFPSDLEHLFETSSNGSNKKGKKKKKQKKEPVAEVKPVKIKKKKARVSTEAATEKKSKKKKKKVEGPIAEEKPAKGKAAKKKITSKEEPATPKRRTRGTPEPAEANPYGLDIGDKVEFVVSARNQRIGGKKVKMKIEKMFYRNSKWSVAGTVNRKIEGEKMDIPLSKLAKDVIKV